MILRFCGTQEFANSGKEGAGISTNFYGLGDEPNLSVGAAQSDPNRFMDSIVSKHCL